MRNEKAVGLMMRPTAFLFFIAVQKSFFRHRNPMFSRHRISCPNLRRKFIWIAIFLISYFLFLISYFSLLTPLPREIEGNFADDAVAARPVAAGVEHAPTEDARHLVVQEMVPPFGGDELRH